MNTVMERESEMKILEGRYGHFSDKGASYTITDWKTPRPWINVISNGTWGLTISQAGGGYSWLEHSMLNRITRWSQDILRDQTGKFLFLRDEDTGESWSLTPQPLKPKFDEYRCVHGMGFTTFLTRAHGIEAEWTLFVPQGLSCEIWRVKLTNLSQRPRRLALLSYFEYLLGAFPDWHREFLNLFVKPRFDKDSNAMIADSTLWTAHMPSDPGWNKDWPYTCFFASDARPSSYTCDREEVFGAYNDWPQAAMLRPGAQLSGRQGMGYDPVCAMQFDISLDPGQSRELSFMLGALPKDKFRREAPKHLKALRAGTQVLLDEVKAHWQELCSRVKVETPDPAVDAMLNYWLKYQTIAARLLGRTAYYQCGGAFGFRDQLQDSQIYLSLEPKKTKAQILLHARHQNKDGTVHHWWHPISEEGRLTDISDDLLWLPYVVCNYLDETMDYGLLKEKAPWLDGGQGTIFDHCRASIEKALSRRSRRGLSLIGEGDWNDGMNGVGVKWKGESVWLSEFFCGVLRSFAAVCRKNGKGKDEALAKRYEARAESLKQAVLKHAWEKDRFIAATKDNGEPLGSAKCKEGSMHLNSQTWAVINGIVEGPRAQKLMAAVEKHLYRDYGILLFTPAHATVDKGIGYLTRYAPGIRENGGVYTHAATWAIIAQAKAGNSEKVYDTFRRICPPLLSNAAPDTYRGEPYVTPGNIEGPESPHEGQGAWTWYSGSSGWLYKAGLEQLLGVQVIEGELVVRPNLPSAWDHASVERIVRGKRMRVDIRRKSGQDYDVRISEVLR
ncbi:MAG: glycosyl transferase family 36 [Elusimicrobiota bacterium]|jgi:cellobiose phosphorylase